MSLRSIQEFTSYSTRDTSLAIAEVSGFLKFPRVTAFEATSYAAEACYTKPAADALRIIGPLLFLKIEGESTLFPSSNSFSSFSLRRFLFSFSEGMPLL